MLQFALTFARLWLLSLLNFSIFAEREPHWIEKLLHSEFEMKRCKIDFDEVRRGQKMAEINLFEDAKKLLGASRGLRTEEEIKGFLATNVEFKDWIFNPRASLFKPLPAALQVIPLLKKSTENEITVILIQSNHRHSMLQILTVNSSGQVSKFEKDDEINIQILEGLDEERKYFAIRDKSGSKVCVVSLPKKEGELEKVYCLPKQLDPEESSVKMLQPCFVNEKLTTFWLDNKKKLSPVVHLQEELQEHKDDKTTPPYKVVRAGEPTTTLDFPVFCSAFLQNSFIELWHLFRGQEGIIRFYLRPDEVLSCFVETEKRSVTPEIAFLSTDSYEENRLTFLDLERAFEKDSFTRPKHWRASKSRLSLSADSFCFSNKEIRKVFHFSQDYSDACFVVTTDEKVLFVGGSATQTIIETNSETMLQQVELLRFRELCYAVEKEVSSELSRIIQVEIKANYEQQSFKRRAIFDVGSSSILATQFDTVSYPTAVDYKEREHPQMFILCSNLEVIKIKPAESYKKFEQVNKLSLQNVQTLQEMVNRLQPYETLCFSDRALVFRDQIISFATEKTYDVLPTKFAPRLGADEIIDLRNQKGKSSLQLRLR